MKKLIFSFILISGFTIAANAQSNNNATGTGTQVQTASESADVPAQTPAKVNESNQHKSCCSSKNASKETDGKKKSCCTDGKKSSANCHDMKKEEKISE